MKLHLRTPANRNRECITIIRNFIASFDEGMKCLNDGIDLGKNEQWREQFLRHGMEFVQQKDEIAQFLERDMDLLTPEERYRVYRHVGAFFPEQCSSIFSVRLAREKDQKCLEFLREMAAIPRDQASERKTAKRCMALFHASKVLREHDAGMDKADKVKRMRELERIALAHEEEEIDGVDLLVLFAIGTEPKDKELFFKATGELGDADILGRKATLKSIVEGLILFGDEERARRLN